MHSLPSDYLSKLPREVREQALGYVSFPTLSVARAGCYRVRITLLKLAGAGEAEQDAQTVAVVETGILRVGIPTSAPDDEDDYE